MCQSLFFNKVADLKQRNSFKKETLAQLFFCEFCEISKNAFLPEHLRTTASGPWNSILISNLGFFL